MDIAKVESAHLADYPDALLRAEYTSGVDGHRDWALVWPDAQATDWVVMIHGHGAAGDQLYTRADMRDSWIPAFRTDRKLGILTPNMRGNAWMSPAAVADLRELLSWVRERYGARRFYFASGSMGGTSNLIYASQYPDDVAGIVALGLASDLESFHAWCRSRTDSLPNELANAIETAYGATPQMAPELYQAHSAVCQSGRLTMPIYLAHGTNDQIIPIQQPRKLLSVLVNKPNLTYIEIPDGGHDAPLALMRQGLEWIMQASGQITPA